MRLKSVILLLILVSCRGMVMEEEEGVRLRVVAPGVMKSADPPEEVVADLNVLIFGPGGLLEDSRYYSPAAEVLSGGDYVMDLNLLREQEYTACIAANVGFKLNFRTLDQAQAWRYYMAWPDEYSRGMLMGATERFSVSGPGEVSIPLRRAMAKVSIRIDRSKLDSDIRFTAERLVVGGCPNSVRLFGESKVLSSDGVFATGFSKSGSEVSRLNRDESLSMSYPISAFVLENLQGDLLEGITADSEKLITDRRGEVCSWIELYFEYHSSKAHSLPGEYLVYRFYLGESLGNFDVRRNTHYQVTVTPQGDGLNEKSWRVDQSAIEQDSQPVRFDLHPAAYNECSSKESYHIWCDISPSDTPFEIEALAYDDHENVAELYDYTVDTDGHGVTIYPKKGGSALIYFNAGPPINRDTLSLLVIDP